MECAFFIRQTFAVSRLVVVDRRHNPAPFPHCVRVRRCPAQRYRLFYGNYIDTRKKRPTKSHKKSRLAKESRIDVPIPILLQRDFPLFTAFHNKNCPYLVSNTHKKVCSPPPILSSPFSTFFLKKFYCFFFFLRLGKATLFFYV